MISLNKQREKNVSPLVDEGATMFHWNEKLLLPSSTRSLKRRTSLFEKSRDWARRLITLHRPRRNTISNETCPPTQESLPNHSKSFDEDGYLSPMEIKAKLDDISPEDTNDHHSSPLIYRYHDPNIQTQRLPSTSFVAEFQKSLSAVDYIDVDVPEESFKADHIDNDPLESLKYLFNLPSKHQQSGNITRRIPRRSTNASSISTDSGYSDIPVSTLSKVIPVHLISCSLIPVNVRYLTCTCRSSSSTACLSNNQPERKLYSPPLLLRMNGSQQQAPCKNKSHSTMTVYPSIMKTDQAREDYYHYRRSLKKLRLTLSRHPSITDDLISISRWYKPYLEREAVSNVLQQADYGAFILRNSSTHADCYALSIKVPKFTHESNIVHYLIERILTNDHPSYRIQGTSKTFPTLLSLLTHHSVMPEILPITLSLNESFID